MTTEAEHLTDEQMLELIAGTSVSKEAETFEHLADCDSCRALFGKLLRDAEPSEKLHLRKHYFKIKIQLLD